MNNYDKLFNHLKNTEPPSDLLPKIMFSFKKEQKRKILIRKIHLSIFSLLTIVSAVSLIPAINSFINISSQSGFLSFLSLIFSDFKIMLANWQIFAFSLLESLPVLNLTIILFIVFVLLGSLRFLSKDLKIISKSNKLAIN